MTMLTNSVPGRLVPGTKMWYGLDYEQLPKKYMEFMNVMTSTRAFEEIKSVTGVGAAVLKSEGEALAAVDMMNGFTQRLTYASYGLIMHMSREFVNDDQYAPKLAEQVGGEFAKSMKHSEELLSHSVLNDGFSTVSGAAANLYQNPDAVALFSASHVLKGGGTFSNKLSTAADLSQLSLETLIVQLRNYTNDVGQRIGVEPVKLLVNPADEFNAKRLLNSVLESGSPNNDVNVLSGMLQLVVDPYLTDTDAYFITTSLNTKENGLIFMRRQEAQIDQDVEFTTKNARISILSGMGVGYAGDARCICGSEGA
jgi:hypothetical protein